MSFKKTLVLALLLCAAIYYLVSVEIPAKIAAGKKEMAFKDFDKSKISSVEIAKTDGSFIMQNAELGKENGKWQLSEIPGAYLDQAVISSFLGTLGGLKLDSTLPKEDLDSDLSVYGLKDPSLTLNIKGSPDSVIQIGKKNDYLGKYYLKISNDENIYLVDDALFSAANKTREDFRDKTPFEFFDTELKSITLKNSDKIIKLERSAVGDWQMIQPVNAGASLAAVSEYTRNLRNLSASRLIDKPFQLAEYKLDNAGLSVMLEYPENKKPAQEILISKVEKDNAAKYYFYLKDGPTIYETLGDPFVSLAKTPDDFREKNVFSFATDLVKGAEAEGEGFTKISLVKVNNEWKVNGQPGDKVFVDQWLSNLSELQAHSFPESTADYGFEKPKYKVSIEMGEGKKNLTIGSVVAGKEVIEGKSKEQGPSKLYYAAGDDLKNPFIISEDTFKKITVRFEALIVTPENATPAALPSPAFNTKPAP